MKMEKFELVEFYAELYIMLCEVNEKLITVQRKEKKQRGEIEKIMSDMRYGMILYCSAYNYMVKEGFMTEIIVKEYKGFTDHEMIDLMNEVVGKMALEAKSYSEFFNKVFGVMMLAIHKSIEKQEVEGFWNADKLIWAFWHVSNYGYEHGFMTFEMKCLESSEVEELYKTFVEANLLAGRGIVKGNAEKIQMKEGEA
jgi:hypothetical protein